MITRCSSLLLLTVLAACDTQTAEPEAAAEDPRLEKCPKIHMDKMAGQWIRVQWTML